MASSKDPDALANAFVGYPGVSEVLAQGDTKLAVILESGISADLRVIDDELFPYALHHFTGSKEHNTQMRGRARKRGMKMNEYGLFIGEELVPCADEEAISRLFSNYIDNVKAYTQKQKVKNKYTGQDEEPDERLMRSIEEKIEIPESRKDDFRREIMNYIGALAIEGNFKWLDKNKNGSLTVKEFPKYF